jgi:4-hydroxy-2-oxoheptanedioate aldolase
MSKSPRAGSALAAQSAASTKKSPVSSEPIRTNPVIKLLEADKPAFSVWVNYYGVGSDYQTATAAQSNPNYDFLLYDLEHNPFDTGHLQAFLQNLLDPAAIATGGVSATKPVIVRIPANGREMNEWVVKQVLDTGVSGLMFPHIETREQALNAVRASRYPQKPGALDFEPEGKRGFSNAPPARYWGLGMYEYNEQADIWKLDPNGNLLLIFIIENQLGVENVRDIARALNEANVGCILWAGGGDLMMSYGNDMTETGKGIDRILAAGKEFGIPVGMNNTRNALQDYAKGARAFFSIGPAAFAGEPVTPEVRKALGR